MKDEYLWNKSGEPDPEIQHLEEILSSLRYQPKPFELPVDMKVAQSRRYRPLLSIAAALLITLLAGLAWLIFHNKPISKPTEANNIAVPTPKSDLPPTDEKQVVREELASRPLVARHERKGVVKTSRTGRSQLSAPSKEAILAKEQLLVALRLASEKLNLAQRKAQGPSPSQIRNQHKIG